MVTLDSILINIKMIEKDFEAVNSKVKELNNECQISMTTIAEERERAEKAEASVSKLKSVVRDLKGLVEGQYTGNAAKKWILDKTYKIMEDLEHEEKHEALKRKMEE